MRQHITRGAVASLGLLPGAGLACALPPSIVLTLPVGYYMTGAAITVLLTAWLAALAPRLHWPQPIELLRVPIKEGAGWISYVSFLVFLALLVTGFAGPRDPMHNLLTLVFWTGVWVALPLASMLLGDLWRVLNPWSGPVRMMRILLGRKGRAGLSKWGAWPAVVGFSGFAWFQIVSLAPEDPLILAQAAALYWLVIFVAGVLEGEDWLREGEFLTLFFSMVSGLSMLSTKREEGRVVLGFGWPGHRILAMPPLSVSGQVFVLAVLSMLSFDGLQATFFWLNLIGENPLEFTGRSAVQAANTLGLIGAFLLTAASIYGALALGRKLSGERLEPGPVMLSFLAIAAGYHAAHYLLMLLTSGQYTLAALNDPLLQGDQLLGLEPFWISMGFLTDWSVMVTIWNLQFGIILGVHILAVMLALHQAPEGKRGLAHGPLSVLMVGYTVFGLWLLSSPVGV